MCTNQGATSTSDTQAVNACTWASISEPTSSLIQILLKNKKTDPEQRVTCVCSGQQSINVTRSTGTDADCSYMDKDSRFNMIVYVRKNNYMKGSGSATIK